MIAGVDFGPLVDAGQARHVRSAPAAPLYNCLASVIGCTWRWVEPEGYPPNTWWPDREGWPDCPVADAKAPLRDERARRFLEWQGFRPVASASDVPARGVALYACDDPTFPEPGGETGPIFTHAAQRLADGWWEHKVGRLGIVETIDLTLPSDLAYGTAVAFYSAPDAGEGRHLPERRESDDS